MDVKPEHIALLTILSTTFFGVLGYLLNILVKKVDVKLDKLNDNVTILLTENAVYNKEHERHKENIEWLLNKHEEQQKINLSFSKLESDYRHYKKSNDTAVGKLIDWFDKQKND